MKTTANDKFARLLLAALWFYEMRRTPLERQPHWGCAQDLDVRDGRRLQVLVLHGRSPWGSAGVGVGLGDRGTVRTSHESLDMLQVPKHNVLML